MAGLGYPWASPISYPMPASNRYVADRAINFTVLLVLQDHDERWDICEVNLFVAIAISFDLKNTGLQDSNERRDIIEVNISIGVDISLQHAGGADADIGRCSNCLLYTSDAADE